MPLERPVRILFIGNSYTHGGPVPHLVRDLAVAAGWPEPDVTQVAPGGTSLRFHRAHAATLAAIDEGSWDVVVLQDQSMRPTERGDPAGFAEDVAWFADRTARRSPGARLVLFETWAREPRHALYPSSYADPRQMQAELRHHYRRAAADIGAVVAPVGDAWEAALGAHPSLVLHGEDLHHAGPAGQVLTAMVFFATIFERPPPDVALGLSRGPARRLREVVAGLRTGP